MDNDEQARIARANRLREQIGQVVGTQKTDPSTAPACTSPDSATPSVGAGRAETGAMPAADAPTETAMDAGQPKAPPTKESPREFIHRRMRELDEGRAK